MSNDKIKEAYKAVESTGLFIDEADFRQQLTSDSKSVYNLFNDTEETQGLFIDYDDFQESFGLKKKSSQFVSLDGESSSSEPNPAVEAFRQKVTPLAARVKDLENKISKSKLTLSFGQLNEDNIQLSVLKKQLDDLVQSSSKDFEATKKNILTEVESIQKELTGKTLLLTQLEDNILKQQNNPEMKEILGLLDRKKEIGGMFTYVPTDEAGREDYNKRINEFNQQVSGLIQEYESKYQVSVQPLLDAYNKAAEEKNIALEKYKAAPQRYKEVTEMSEVLDEIKYPLQSKTSFLVSKDYNMLIKGLESIPKFPAYMEALQASVIQDLSEFLPDNEYTKFVKANMLAMKQVKTQQADEYKKGVEKTFDKAKAYVDPRQQQKFAKEGALASPQNLISSVIGTVLQQAPAIAMSAANPAAGTVAFGAMMMEEGYETGKAAGLTEDESLRLAAVYTPIGTWLEKLPLEKAFGKSPMTLIAAEVAAAKAAGKEITEDLLVNTTKNTLQKTIKQYGIVMGTEAITELTQDKFLAAGVRLTKAGGNPIKAIEELKNEAIKKGALAFVKEIAEQDLETGIVAGLSGGAMKGGIDASRTIITALNKGQELPTKQQTFYEASEVLSKNPREYAKFVDEIKNQSKLGVITEQEAADIITTAESYTAAQVEVRTIPQESKRTAFDLVREKKGLEAEIDGVDKSVAAPQRQRIEQIETTLTAISTKKPVTKKLENGSPKEFAYRANPDGTIQTITEAQFKGEEKIPTPTSQNDTKVQAELLKAAETIPDNESRVFVFDSLESIPEGLRGQAKERKTEGAEITINGKTTKNPDTFRYVLILSGADLRAAQSQATQPTNIEEQLVRDGLIDRNGDALFNDGGEFARILGGAQQAAVPSSYETIDGVPVVSFTNPQTNQVDVVMSGTSNTDYVGFYRIYENGKPTNKWSSKMQNTSRNKDAFKTMMREVQNLLPDNHQYTEKTNISTDGLRVWEQQLRRGYEVQRDANGDIVTNEVAINGDALTNELGIDVEQGRFNNITVTTEAEFNKVKAALLPYMKRLGLTENNIRRKTIDEVQTVVVDLPILSSTKSNTREAEINKKLDAAYQRLINNGMTEREANAAALQSITEEERQVLRDAYNKSRKRQATPLQTEQESQAITEPLVGEQPTTDSVGATPTPTTVYPQPSQVEADKGATNGALRDVEGTAKALEAGSVSIPIISFNAKPKPTTKQGIEESNKWINDLFDKKDGTRIKDKNGKTYEIKGGTLRELTLDEEGNVTDSSVIYRDSRVYKKNPYANPEFFNDGYVVLSSDNKQISEAYHKAKQDGSNPELVKAVEELLAPAPIEEETGLEVIDPVEESKAILNEYNRKEVHNIIRAGKDSNKGTLGNYLGQEKQTFNGGTAVVDMYEYGNIQRIILDDGSKIQRLVDLSGEVIQDPLINLTMSAMEAKTLFKGKDSFALTEKEITKFFNSKFGGKSSTSPKQTQQPKLAPAPTTNETKQQQQQPTKTNQNATKQQSGAVRNESKQNQPKGSSDSNMPNVNETKLQDGKKAAKKTPEEIAKQKEEKAVRELRNSVLDIKVSKLEKGAYKDAIANIKRLIAAIPLERILDRQPTDPNIIKILEELSVTKGGVKLNVAKLTQYYQQLYPIANKAYKDSLEKTRLKIEEKAKKDLAEGFSEEEFNEALDPTKEDAPEEANEKKKIKDIIRELLSDTIIAYEEKVKTMPNADPEHVKTINEIVAEAKDGGLQKYTKGQLVNMFTMLEQFMETGTASNLTQIRNTMKGAKTAKEIATFTKTAVGTMSKKGFAYFDALFTDLFPKVEEKKKALAALHSNAIAAINVGANNAKLRLDDFKKKYKSLLTLDNATTISVYTWIKQWQQDGETQEEIMNYLNNMVRDMESQSNTKGSQTAQQAAIKAEQLKKVLKKLNDPNSTVPLLERILNADQREVYKTMVDEIKTIQPELYKIAFENYGIMLPLYDEYLPTSVIKYQADNATSNFALMLEGAKALSGLVSRHKGRVLSDRTGRPATKDAFYDTDIFAVFERTLLDGYIAIEATNELQQLAAIANNSNLEAALNHNGAKLLENVDISKLKGGDSKGWLSSHGGGIYSALATTYVDYNKLEAAVKEIQPLIDEAAKYMFSSREGQVAMKALMDAIKNLKTTKPNDENAKTFRENAIASVNTVLQSSRSVGLDKKVAQAVGELAQGAGTRFFLNTLPQIVKQSLATIPIVVHATVKGKPLAAGKGAYYAIMTMTQENIWSQFGVQRPIEMKGVVQEAIIKSGILDSTAASEYALKVKAARGLKEQGFKNAIEYVEKGQEPFGTPLRFSDVFARRMALFTKLSMNDPNWEKKAGIDPVNIADAASFSQAMAGIVRPEFKPKALREGFAKWLFFLFSTAQSQAALTKIYVKQAAKALGRGDVDTAVNLSEKASSLIINQMLFEKFGSPISMMFSAVYLGKLAAAAIIGDDDDEDEDEEKEAALEAQKRNNDHLTEEEKEAEKNFLEEQARSLKTTAEERKAEIAARQAMQDKAEDEAPFFSGQDKADWAKAGILTILNITMGPRYPYLIDAAKELGNWAYEEGMKKDVPTDKITELTSAYAYGNKKDRPVGELLDELASLTTLGGLNPEYGKPFYVGSGSGVGIVSSFMAMGKLAVYDPLPYEWNDKTKTLEYKGDEKQGKEGMDVIKTNARSRAIIGVLAASRDIGEYDKNIDKITQKQMQAYIRSLPLKQLVKEIRRIGKDVRELQEKGLISRELEQVITSELVKAQIGEIGVEK
jgi:hypothetical protein